MFGMDHPYTDDEVMRARGAYYGLIEWMDAKMGRFLDALEEHGLAENTVVIYTSDHGDSLGEHGLWRKMSMYEASSHIPIQIAWPKKLPSGVRVANPVSNVDVTATILDLAGVDPKRWRVDGDSLVALANGDSDSWKDYALVEHLAHGTDRALAMIRVGDWKISYGYGDPPEIELYDLATDPDEFDNLAGNPQHAEKQAEMLARLLEIWGDPAEIQERVMRSQEERLIIRSVDGGKLF